MVAILVTGMSGTGTSTALAELARRGFGTVDTDYGGFSVERWSAEESRPEQVWDEIRIDELLAEHEARASGEPLFVGGCVSNQRQFYPRFAAVEPRLRARADAEIDTRAPIAEVADRLVRLAQKAS